MFSLGWRRPAGQGSSSGGGAAREETARRDHGGRVFIDLRDRSGISQVVFGPDLDKEAHALAGDLRSEFCVGVAGRVISRGENQNLKIPTGEIEVEGLVALENCGG